jgi:hypothetical protein
MSELTIQDVEKAIDKGFEKQAIFINRAFEAQANHFEGRLDKKIDDLRDDLKSDIHRVEAKVDKALHVEYINLEVRVKRIENKLGLTPTN